MVFEKKKYINLIHTLCIHLSIDRIDFAFKYDKKATKRE